MFFKTDAASGLLPSAVSLSPLGVLLHIPMFWMGHNNGFVLYGMPMDPSMIFGMYLIIAGVIAAGYGLLPSKSAYNAVVSSRITVVAPEDAPLNRAHWIADGDARGRAHHRRDEARHARIHHSGDDPGISNHQSARFAGSVFRAHRDGERLDSLGRPGGLLWPQSSDPVVGRRLYRHLDLRRDAVA